MLKSSSEFWQIRVVKKMDQKGSISFMDFFGDFSGSKMGYFLKEL